MAKSYNWSTCPVCGSEYRFGWSSFRMRWARWLALFFGIWITLIVWYSLRWSSDSRLLYAFTACMASYISFFAWIFFNASLDAKQHKACLKQRDWTMWLVPILLPLTALVSGAVVGGFVYLVVWGLQYLRMVLSALV